MGRAGVSRILSEAYSLLSGGGALPPAFSGIPSEQPVTGPRTVLALRQAAVCPLEIGLRSSCAFRGSALAAPSQT